VRREAEEDTASLHDVDSHAGDLFAGLIDDANGAALIVLAVSSKLTRDDGSMRSCLVQAGKLLPQSSSIDRFSPLTGKKYLTIPSPGEILPEQQSRWRLLVPRLRSATLQITLLIGSLKSSAGV
jgi:hypothetical protein